MTLYPGFDKHGCSYVVIPVSDSQVSMMFILEHKPGQIFNAKKNDPGVAYCRCGSSTSFQATGGGSDDRH